MITYSSVTRLSTLSLSMNDHRTTLAIRVGSLVSCMDSRCFRIQLFLSYTSCERWKHIEVASTLVLIKQQILKSFITLQDGTSIIKGFHALAEPAIGTWDIKDMPSDDGESRWKLPGLDTSSQFSGDRDLEEIRRCPDHDCTGNDLSLR